MWKFGIKSIIVGSAVYYTVEKGVWGDTDTTNKIYEGLKTEVFSPYMDDLRKQIPYEFPELPQSGRISFLMNYYWNYAVKSTFKFVVNLPTHTSDAMSKAYSMVNSTLEAVEPSPSSSSTKDEVKE